MVNALFSAFVVLLSLAVCSESLAQTRTAVSETSAGAPISQSSTLRIASPMPGLVTGTERVDVVVVGPPGRVFKVWIDDRESIELSFGPEGRHTISNVPFAPHAAELKVAVTMETDGVVVAKAGTWLRRAPRFVDTWDPPARPSSWRQGASVVSMLGLPLVASIFSGIILDKVRGVRFYDLWLLNNMIIAAVSPALVLGSLDSRSDHEMWVAAVTSVGLAALMIGVAEALRADGQRDQSSAILFGSMFAIPLVTMGAVMITGAVDDDSGHVGIGSKW